MEEKDFERIAQIANHAANNAQHSLITKAIVEAFKTYGIHSAEQMQHRMNFVDRAMSDSKAMRKGFFSGIGGHIATVVIAVTLAWGVTKGWFGK